MSKSSLFSIIHKDVFENKKIKTISQNGADEPVDFIFDFKGVSLRTDFLKSFATEFWSYIEMEGLKKVQVGGMETGAIALLAGLSLYAPTDIEANFFFIRKSRKRHDLAKIIEGELNKNVSCILIDDILNKGNTLRKQVVLLEAEGIKVTHLFTCLRFRDNSAYEEFAHRGIKIKSIFELNNFSSVLPVRNIKEKTEADLFAVYTKVEKATFTRHPNLYLVVPKSAPLLVEDYLYFGTDDGNMICLDTVQKKVVWEFAITFGSAGKRILSSPAYYKDSIIFGAYDGNVYCLNRFTGHKQWVNFEADWVGSSPAINTKEGVVYVGLEYGLFKKRGGLVAIKIKTGTVLWTYRDMTGLTHASPAYNAKHDIVVCGCNDGFMRAFKAKTGELMWEFKTEGDIKYGASFDETNTYVTFASFDKNIYVVSLKDGILFARHETEGEIYSHPIFQAGTVVATSLDKHIYCFGLNTKSLLWKVGTNGRIFSLPVYDKKAETIVVGGNDGVLYEIQHATGVVVAKVQLPDRIVNRVVIQYKQQSKIFFVLSHEGHLFRISA